MFIYAISLLTGVSQLLWLPHIKLAWLLLSLFSVVTCSLLRYFHSKYKHFYTSFLVFFIGFSYGMSFAHLYKIQQLKEAPKKSITIIGSVEDLPRISDKKIKFILNVEKAPPEFSMKKILVNWYGTKQNIKPGQKWQFQLKLKPIHALYNPNSFDYSRWLFRQGINATATVKEGILLDGSNYSIVSAINLFRLSIINVVQENIESKRIAPLLIALSVGDKTLISAEDSELFQKTGTAHLIAISGLHIGLIAFVGLLVGRLLFYLISSQIYNRFIFEAVCSIAFALSYALLAGMSTPTLRALVMVVVFAIAYVLKSQVSRWQAWSFALVFILVIDPLSVLDAGFWFSYCAVAVLMYAYTGRVFITNKLLGFIKAQFVILIGLMPLMLVIFNQFNLLAPFANFVVLPLASVLLIPLLFLALFVQLFSDYLSGYLFVVVEHVAQLLFIILDYLQRFDFLKIETSGYSVFYVSILCLATMIVLLPRLFRWRWVVLVLYLPLFFDKQNDLKLKEYRLSVLDVSQGLSILVQTKNQTLLYDTGAKYESGFSMAKAVIIPFLQSRGIEKVDKLILSHADNDHAGGVNEIISRYNPKVYGVKGPYKSCQYPLTWTWDEVNFEVLSPFELQPYMGNNSSCVIKVSSEFGSVLLTGDIEEPVEYRLITQFPNIIKSDVLIVPHHGSRSSSSKNFVKQVSPSLAINSSGFANQFNHPHKLIKQIYQGNGIEFLDTQNQGMIEVTRNSKGSLVRPYLKNNQHFWYVN